MKPYESYILQKDHNNLLIVGRLGMELCKDALYIAASLLEVPETRLLQHPDFLLVQTDKKNMLVEDIEPIFQKSGLQPVLANKSIVVIDGLDTLNEVGQNKLLKILENSETMLIIATVYGHVLPTIRSRMQVLAQQTMGKEEFMEYCMKQSIPNGVLYFYATGGCEQYIKQLEPILPILQSTVSCIESNDSRKLLVVLHMLKEKDMDNFYQKYTVSVPLFLAFLEAMFTLQLRYLMFDQGNELFTPSKQLTKEKTFQILDEIRTHKVACKGKSYTVINFMQLFVNII